MRKLILEKLGVKEIDKDDLEEKFVESVNDEHTVEICGVSFEAAEVLRELDIGSFKDAFNDWLENEIDDSELINFEGRYYLSDDFYDAQTEAINEWAEKQEKDLSSAYGIVRFITHFSSVLKCELDLIDERISVIIGDFLSGKISLLTQEKNENSKFRKTRCYLEASEYQRNIIDNLSLEQYEVAMNHVELHFNKTNSYKEALDLVIAKEPE